MQILPLAVLVGLSLVSQALAAIYVTDPVASTNCTASLPCNVTWKDDGLVPSLAAIGNCSIQLCSGGDQTQTCFQTISSSWNVTHTNVTYENNPKDGPNGTYYFLKFRALNYTSPTNPSQPYEAFSSRFTLSGMTGTFNASVMAEITGSQGISVASSSSKVASSTAAAVTATSTPIASSVTSSISTASSTAKAKSGAVALTLPSAFASFVGVTVVFGFAGVALTVLALGL